MRMSFAQIPTQKVEGEELTFIDETQRFITNQWLGLNYNLDLFFTAKDYNQKQNKSLILGYYGFNKKESRVGIQDYDVKMRFHLPKASERMRIVLEKERDEILGSNNPDSPTNLNPIVNTNDPNTPKSSDFVAGVSYFAPKREVVKTFFDVGMKIKLPLDPYSKLQFQKTFELGFMNIFLYQGLFLYRQDGFQENSQISFSKKINSFFRIEQVNSLGWSDKLDKFSPRNNLIFYYLIEQNSINLSFGANGQFSPQMIYTSYDVTLNFRKLSYKDWFYINYGVGAEYPKIKNFNSEYFAFIRTEIFFR
jgi:hypothetical protein